MSTGMAFQPISRTVWSVGALCRAIADALDLTDAEIVRLAENSFTGSFLPMADQIQHLAEIAEVAGGR